MVEGYDIVVGGGFGRERQDRPRAVEGHPAEDCPAPHRGAAAGLAARTARGPEESFQAFTLRHGSTSCVRCLPSRAPKAVQARGDLGFSGEGGGRMTMPRPRPAPHPGERAVLAGPARLALRLFRGAALAGLSGATPLSPADAAGPPGMRLPDRPRRRRTTRPGTIRRSRLSERLKLAEGRPLAARLMAAMAQLDCGQCGYDCPTYAEGAFPQAAERLNLCAPGGKETLRALKKLAEEFDAALPGRSPPRRRPCPTPRRSPAQPLPGTPAKSRSKALPVAPPAQRRGLREGDLARRDRPCRERPRLRGRRQPRRLRGQRPVARRFGDRRSSARGRSG